MCDCPDDIKSLDELCVECTAEFILYRSEADVTKKLMEIAIPILGINNAVIGTYCKRYNTRAEAKRDIFTLESQGMKFKDAFNEKYWTVVEVPDEQLMQ